MFASDVPTTFRLIGEAKTALDLETERSRRQIRAFLDHLSLYPGSAFYLAVPPAMTARARHVVRLLQAAEHGSVQITIMSHVAC